MTASDTNFSSSVFVKIPDFLKNSVKNKGIKIATAIQIKKYPIYLTLIDRKPGRPPTPIELAWTLKVVAKRPATLEPIIPATNG